ncbi:hypothetical protein [Saccharopolyspora elongata]|uniref:Uncharacterized protein n=1 Tax=Saccharopolyspora elongata TaxID=2530387 RepID=A0A4R4XZJ7_9PSEU|nr:hypothetical protein [Saccharopolyspora elongata]TDD36770.1 hypothetical protein E1288_41470 [Saccharopolyspora elongata]
MTQEERTEIDGNPLWTYEGQVLWTLEQQGEESELVTAAGIVELLELPKPAVSHVLHELRAKGKALSRKVGRQELWGTPDRMKRWIERREQEERRAAAERAAARARLVERNDALAEVAQQLRGICADHQVDVSLFDWSMGRSEEPCRHTLVLSVDDPQAANWVLGRLSMPAPNEGAPTDAQWSEHAERFETILGCLTWAGWEEGEDDYFAEYDQEIGPVLCTTLRRTCMTLSAEYHPDDRTLRLQPYEDPASELPEVFSMLADQVVIEMEGDINEQEQSVARRAGELGLLDATRVEVYEDATVSLRQFMAFQYHEWIFKEAAQYRGITVPELADELDALPDAKNYLNVVVSMFGGNVLPDAVPDAAVLGIAAWCWRNNTAVEDWHVESDVLMARINIAVTKAIEEHVNAFDGIDWAHIKASLTDPDWALPDGRKIGELFGEGWPHVRDTVSEELQKWQHLDENVLGPDATLRLLTIGGSTSYTWNWWGQGRWSAICRAIVEDAVAGGIALPSPYDSTGAERLIADLAKPDQLGDEVLRWLIDMPAADPEGPRGLRFHEATRPPVRVVEPVDWDLD